MLLGASEQQEDLWQQAAGGGGGGGSADDCMTGERRLRVRRPARVMRVDMWPRCRCRLMMMPEFCL